MATYNESSDSYARRNLPATTFSVFQKCAHLYPNKDMHWGADLDIIFTELKNIADPNVLDAGCGTGWHLKAISGCNSNVSTPIGLDFSTAMLRCAKQVISERQSVRNPKLVRGNLLTIPLRNEHFDFVLCLNNTLGNLCGKTFEDSRDQRRHGLAEVRRVLKSGGSLILSVYNASRISREKYGNVFVLDPLLSSFDTNDFIIRFVDTQAKSNGGIPYYSHWFTRDEVEQLLEACDFKVKRIVFREKRIVVVAKKG